jgi:hypothetical protein
VAATTCPKRYITTNLEKLVGNQNLLKCRASQPFCFWSQLNSRVKFFAEEANIKDLLVSVPRYLESKE